jgi:DNA invertase Pin-like site-specific DNA recombinase
MSHKASSILDFIRPADVLIVVKMDRLGRNTRDVLNLVHELKEKGASLRGLEPAIDTGGPRGHMVLAVLGIVVEMVAWLYPRSAARGHRRRESEGRLKRPSRLGTGENNLSR